MFIYLSYEDQVRAHNYALGVVNEKKKYFNCSHESYLIGALGELAYGHATNQEVNFEVYEGYKGDGGIDFPDGTDVKTSTWQGGGVQLKVSRKNPKKCKQYALCRIVDHNKKKNYTEDLAVQVLGVISYKDFHKNKLKSFYDYDFVYEDKLIPLPNEIDGNYPIQSYDTVV